MKRLAHVASRFINTPLMIHPPKLEVIIRALGPRLGIDPDVVLAQRVPMDATATLMARYSEAGDDRDYAVIDGIAVIPVQGTLLKKESFMSAFSGATSYEQIERQVASAVEDAGVLGILLDIDSPGGETAGCFELSDYIYSIRGVKPVYAAANDVALSAAYALASAATRVFVTRTGALGSVGVYALHVDQSGFDKAMGAKYTYIFAGDKKIEGNPHEPLAKGAKDDIQAEVDREYGIFTETVARNRDADKKEIVATQAGVVWADNALPLFGDEVGTLDDAMAALRQVVGKRGISMAAPAAISRQGDHGMKTPVLALAPDGGDAKIDQPIGAGKEGCDPDKGAEPDAKKKTPEPDGKGKAPEPGDKKPEPDDEDEDEKDGKKAAAAPLVLAQGEPLTAVRGEGDIKAIGALCKLAGCPERAPELLTAKTQERQLPQRRGHQRNADARARRGKRETHDRQQRGPTQDRHRQDAGRGG